MAPLQPWYIATETFTSRRGKAWKDYIAWSGLTQLDEVVSLDHMLCPTLLPEVRTDYWPHIVNEDFMFEFFIDLEFRWSRPRRKRRSVPCEVM
ncbi:MAG TPA: hypothetical protein VI485_18305 [Vicinamibacterales bacterium]|nr:hypothetical protein [Vicinamibacterales bacterium]